ncbi:MAG: four-carbon acid sugar kinase family protein [Haliea sp.]|nr:MAG: four-carbon acid sugar kinase family protein [Haliea sp.]
MGALLLGCIADDFTGATDLANNLVRAGMRVVQTIGVPSGPLDADVDAVVVALKSRTVPAAQAVSESLAALAWLQQQGAQQIYFKYCSTFDSTAEGNIGPVTDALMDALGTGFTIATPAFPDNQRTVFKGYLFVGDVLLNESGMQNHPLTPMRDANLVRVLQAQTKRRVGLIDHRTVARGEAAVREQMAQLQANGIGVAVVDAVSNEDLLRLGPAWKGLPLVTAGSGVAIGLPANFGISPSDQASRLPSARGLRAVVSGSCSLATNRQVQDFIRQGHPAMAIDPLRLASGTDVVSEVLAWAEPLLARGPVLVYSTDHSDAVKAVQGKMGVAEAGALVERTLAAAARGLVALGVRQLVVAGGETSGACVQALGITQMQIGPQIDPGVPWCHTVLPPRSALRVPAAPPGGVADLGAARRSSGLSGDDGLHLTLKSGNFGTDDFFSKAFTMLA